MTHEDAESMKLEEEKPTAPIISSVIGWILVVALIGPVVAFVLRLSFSAASHLWGLATF